MNVPSKNDELKITSELISLKEAAIFLRMSERWVSLEARSLRLRSYRIGKYLRFKIYDLNQWIKGQDSWWQK